VLSYPTWAARLRRAIVASASRFLGKADTENRHVDVRPSGLECGLSAWEHRRETILLVHPSPWARRPTGGARHIPVRWGVRVAGAEVDFQRTDARRLRGSEGGARRGRFGDAFLEGQACLRELVPTRRRQKRQSISSFATL